MDNIYICPECGDTFNLCAISDGQGSDRDREPDEHPVAGDFTTCDTCHTVLRFIDEHTLIKVTSLPDYGLTDLDRAELEQDLKSTPSLSAQTCPCCNASLNSSACMDNSTKQRPTNGDICLCYECGEFLEFNDGLIKMPSESFSYLSTEQQELMLRTQQQIKNRESVWNLGEA